MAIERINELVAEMNKLAAYKSIARLSSRAARKNSIKNELLESGVLVEWNNSKNEYEAHEISGYCIDNDMVGTSITKEVDCSFEEAMKIAKEIGAYGKNGVRIFDKNGYVATAIERKKAENADEE